MLSTVLQSELTLCLSCLSLIPYLDTWDKVSTIFANECDQSLVSMLHLDITYNNYYYCYHYYNHWNEYLRRMDEERLRQKCWSGVRLEEEEKKDFEIHGYGK